MCLKYNEKKSNIIRQKLLNNNGKCTFYKLVYKNTTTNTLVSTVFSKIYDIGWNVSNRRSKKIFKNEESYLELGIHVYTSRRTAQRNKYTLDRIIPVQCNLKHFVAAGNNGDAIFTKVYITKRDYDRVYNMRSRF